ncbi:hypothetical protein CUMW_139150, partial [Citrus unshiu]
RRVGPRNSNVSTNQVSAVAFLDSRHTTVPSGPSPTSQMLIIYQILRFSPPLPPLPLPHPPPFLLFHLKQNHQVNDCQNMNIG